MYLSIRLLSLGDSDHTVQRRACPTEVEYLEHRLSVALVLSRVRGDSDEVGEKLL